MIFFCLLLFSLEIEYIQDETKVQPTPIDNSNLVYFISNCIFMTGNSQAFKFTNTNKRASIQLSKSTFYSIKTKSGNGGAFLINFVLGTANAPMEEHFTFTVQMIVK